MPDDFRTRLADAARLLLGVSSYAQGTAPTGPGLRDPSVEAVREALGGALQPVTQTQPRWLLADLESAQLQADNGSMRMAGQLWRSMQRDGMIAGLRDTRTSGLVALPKRFRGRDDIVAELRAETLTRSTFDEMFPPSELALLAGDGIGVGVGVAELVPVPGRDHPVMIRLDPEYLWYKWNEGRWYFNSIAGALPITPGDGRWILHTPGGRVRPWHWGSWQALGRAFIHKEHALLGRGNFSAKLAHPARVAMSPQGANDEHRLSFFRKLMAWGVNTVFSLPAGWDVKLLESNGRGWEVFGKEIETSDLEIMICLAGQVVTVTGGAGFSNADIHRTIRADLIKKTADALAYTINTQGLPAWALARFGTAVLSELPRVAWDVDPPADLKAQADVMASVGAGIVGLGGAMAAAGVRLDVGEVLTRFGVPTLPGTPELPAVAPPPASTPTTPPDTEPGAPDA